MEVFERTQEVVADAHRFGAAADWRFNSYRRQFCRGTLHLYLILMERRKVLEAILTISAVLIGVYIYIAYRHGTSYELLIYISLGLMLTGLASKWLSAKLIWLWFKLAEGMGYVMSRVILTIVFFTFLFPIALLYRMFNKDLLKLSRQDGSTYTDRHHKYIALDLENPW